MTTKKAALLALKILLSAVVIYFVYLQLDKSWLDIREHDWRPDWLILVLSLPVALFSLFIFSVCWRMIIGSFGRAVGYRSAFRISYLSNLGRYIPGKVWQFFGILYLARKEGIAAEEAGASFVIVQMFAIPSSILVYLLCALVEPSILSGKVAILGTGGSVALAAGMILICSILVFYSEAILHLGNLLLRRFGRPAAEFRLDKSVALKLLLGYSLGWIVYGLAFWLFVRAVTGSAALGPVAAIGLYNAAYQAGYLVLFAPGGFGPRELIMGLLLTPFLGPLGAAVAVLSRIWAIVIESGAAAIALSMNKKKEHGETVGQA